jgi:hypothetical protein
MNKTKHQKNGDRKVQDIKLTFEQKKTLLKVNYKGNKNKSIIQTFPSHKN